jgi:hypothetical protein
MHFDELECVLETSQSSGAAVDVEEIIGGSEESGDAHNPDRYVGKFAIPVKYDSNKSYGNDDNEPTHDRCADFLRSFAFEGEVVFTATGDVIFVEEFGDDGYQKSGQDGRADDVEEGLLEEGEVRVHSMLLSF